MDLSSDQINRLLSLLRSRYPDWVTFDHPAFQADEVDYKQATADKAAEWLNKYSLSHLLETKQYDEVLHRLDRIGRDNNLLYLSIPKASDLNILSHPNLEPAAFCEQLYDLLYGPGSVAERFGAYLAYIEAQGLPNKWTFPTYFLFVCHPETEIFIKPRTARRFLKLIEAPFPLGNPSVEGYSRFRDLAHTLQEHFAPYDPRDMIDIQSLIWVTDRQAHEINGAVPLMQHNKWGPFARAFAVFADQYATQPGGAAALVRMAEQAETARHHFETVRIAVPHGKDVTDLVLRTLLPHTDTEAHRAEGTWASDTPAVAGEVKPWFERAGWVEPDAWPAVASALVRFYETCLDHPEDLAEACEAFAAHPHTRGFQAPMLSPLLHALQPADFLAVHHEVQRVLAYFTGTSYGDQLSEYPAVNASGLRFIEEVAPTMRRFGLPPVDDHHVFDLFCRWLVTERRFAPTEPGYWKISPGDQAWQWDESRTEGFIALDWAELGDLSDLDSAAFNERRDACVEQFEDWTKTGANQAWTFAHQITEGDRIVANRGTTEVLGIGTVVGPYYFVPGQRHPHRRPVFWEDCTPRPVQEGGWRRTLVKLGREKFDALSGAPPVLHIAEPAPRYQPERHEPVRPDPTTYREEQETAYSLADCAAETGYSIDELTRWVRAIERKKQAIFYGPPGTGKTYLAHHLARHLLGGGDGFIETVQFHPAYTYEDFMQGLRPTARPDGGLDYPLVPGRFLQFCEAARSRSGRCVLIIDEINRAHLARVFGELMYLLEYRDRDVALASGERLRIPANVRLLGTMNTADRSIALVDHALRRRFAFIALQPRYDLLRAYHAASGFDVEPLVEVLAQLNTQIADPRYEVGISYFLVPDLAAHLEDIWRMEIEPYLEEYFFDQPARVDEYRWEAVQRRLEG